MPSLSRGRQQARSAVCKSNLRQLAIANIGYASENDGFYVRAAYDMFTGFGGRHRWHGMREAATVHPDPEKNTFDPRKGPLSAYLADGKVKKCPQIVKFVEDGSRNAFEAGCGGYGYNSDGVGSRSYQYGDGDKAMRSSMRSTEIRRPAEKVMFTDTAFVQGFFRFYVIEYSFCRPPYIVELDSEGGISERYRWKPSIHFRHLEKTNVAWCDGHICSEEFAFSTFSQKLLDEFRIGWFGPENNKLFRP